MNGASEAGLSSRDAQAMRQAIGLAGRSELPIVARSMTEAEVATLDRRAYSVILGIYGAGAVALLAWYGLGLEGSRLLPLGIAFGFLLSIPLWLVARSMARARRAYRDPGFTIEVGEDGVRVQGPAGEAELTYVDAKVTGFIVQPGRHGIILFLGVTLETPVGAVSLENRNYLLGTRAAAAIVKRRNELGLPALASVA